jgi:hypothetical protein
MAKPTKETEKNEQQESKAPVAITPLNKRKGGSYLKDPKTGDVTLVQETQRTTMTVTTTAEK